MLVMLTRATDDHDARGAGKQQLTLTMLASGPLLEQMMLMMLAARLLVRLGWLGKGS